MNDHTQRNRLLPAVTLMAAILAAQPAVAEVKLLKCPNAEAVSAGCKNFEQTGLTWMYELNVAADKDKRIVKLVVPVSANVGLEMTSTDNLQNVYTTIEEQRREYAYRPIADNQASFVAFTIWATDSTKFKKGQASIGYAQGEAALVHSDVEAPKPLPNGIRIMFGVGNSFKLDDSAEFAITDDGKTLVLEQDSKNRAEGYIGALFKLNLVWAFADLFNGLMALPNLIALLLLSPIIFSETRSYLKDKANFAGLAHESKKQK